jgi:hypothetical protein
MNEELEPLDGDAFAILSTLKPVAEVPSDARERIRGAVEARVAMANGGREPAGTTPRTEGMDANRVEGRGLRGWVARNPLRALAGALIVGALAGAAARGAPPVRVVTVERATATPSSSTAPLPSPWAPVEPLAPGVPPEQSAPAPSTVRTQASSASSTTATGTPATGQQLAAESAILDVARSAIAQGEADHALAAVDRHANTFPHGVLREEREALGVKALVLAGRGEEARARTERFRMRYPESLFLPALESALRSIP